MRSARARSSAPDDGRWKIEDGTARPSILYPLPSSAAAAPTGMCCTTTTCERPCASSTLYPLPSSAPAEPTGLRVRAHHPGATHTAQKAAAPYA